MDPSLPPQGVGTWQAAEENAVVWMRHWGHLDARLTTAGADGGIDVFSNTALGQVKFEAAKVGRPALQRLVGARGMDAHKELFFFSGVGYSDNATLYANAMNMALFEYDLIGRMQPHGTRATQIVAERLRIEQQQQEQQQRPNPPSPVSTSPQLGETQKAWLRRHWAGILGFVLLLQAVLNIPDALHARNGHPWLSITLSVLPTSLLWFWWFRSADRRRKSATSSPMPRTRKTQPTRRSPAVPTTPSPTPAAWAEVLAAGQRGDKIAAVAAYRRATGLGLAESKQAVEVSWIRLSMRPNDSTDRALN